MADETDEIGTTLARLARIHKSPKSLLKAVLEEHPKAKKKDVARAAFRQMIDQADGDGAATLQEVGITARTMD